jgi:hypothetical protein
VRQLVRRPGKHLCRQMSRAEPSRAALSRLSLSPSARLSVGIGHVSICDISGTTMRKLMRPNCVSIIVNVNVNVNVKVNVNVNVKVNVNANVNVNASVDVDGNENGNVNPGRTEVVRCAERNSIVRSTSSALFTDAHGCSRHHP